MFSNKGTITFYPPTVLHSNETVNPCPYFEVYRDVPYALDHSGTRIKIKLTKEIVSLPLAWCTISEEIHE